MLVMSKGALSAKQAETYYQEKRPFFVAGSSAFNFGGNSCFFCSNTSSLGVRRPSPPPLTDAGFVTSCTQSDQRSGIVAAADE